MVMLIPGKVLIYLVSRLNFVSLRRHYRSLIRHLGRGEKTPVRLGNGRRLLLQFDYYPVLAVGGLRFGFLPLIEYKVVTVLVGADDGVFRPAVAFYDNETHGAIFTCKLS